MRTIESIVLLQIWTITLLAAGAPGPLHAPMEANQPTSAPVYSTWPFDANEARRRQEETSKNLGIPRELTLALDGNVTMKLALIPAGKFIMGSPEDEAEKAWKGDETQHEIEISKTFYMGIHPVTRGQFAAFVSSTRYETVAELLGESYGGTVHAVKGASWKNPGFDQTDEHPVVCVAYNDAIAFCEWLSKNSGKTVKLPTEAEWEYACRAGTTTAYQWGGDPNNGKGWCNAFDQAAEKQFPKRKGFQWDDGYVFTSPVGKFKPNAFGLFDMHGNAAQWCSDWYDRKYYLSGNNVDPQGPDSGQNHVLRGGDWCHGPQNSRSANRGLVDATYSSYYIGFRVICPVTLSIRRPL